MNLKMVQVRLEFEQIGWLINLLALVTLTAAISGLHLYERFLIHKTGILGLDVDITKTTTSLPGMSSSTSSTVSSFSQAHAHSSSHAGGGATHTFFRNLNGRADTATNQNSTLPMSRIIYLLDNLSLNSYDLLSHLSQGYNQTQSALICLGIPINDTYSSECSQISRHYHPATGMSQTPKFLLETDGQFSQQDKQETRLLSDKELSGRFHGNLHGPALPGLPSTSVNVHTGGLQNLAGYNGQVADQGTQTTSSMSATTVYDPDNKAKLSTIIVVMILYVMALFFLILVFLSREFCFDEQSNYTCFMLMFHQISFASLLVANLLLSVSDYKVHSHQYNDHTSYIALAWLALAFLGVSLLLYLSITNWCFCCWPEQEKKNRSGGSRNITQIFVKNPPRSRTRTPSPRRPETPTVRKPKTPCGRNEIYQAVEQQPIINYSGFENAHQIR